MGMAEALSVRGMSRDQCGLRDDESERRGWQCTARSHLLVSFRAAQELYRTRGQSGRAHDGPSDRRSESLNG